MDGKWNILTEKYRSSVQLNRKNEKKVLKFVEKCWKSKWYFDVAGRKRQWYDKKEFEYYL